MRYFKSEVEGDIRELKDEIVYLKNSDRENIATEDEILLRIKDLERWVRQIADHLDLELSERPSLYDDVDEAI